MAMMVLVVVALSSPVTGGNARMSMASLPSPGAVPPIVDPLNQLPSSDAVAVADVNRLLSEAARVYGSSAGGSAKINAEIDRFRSVSGIDPRLVDRMAAGVRFSQVSPTVTKMLVVAIAQGRFDSQAAIAARRASRGKFTEEKYKGSSIYRFSVNDQLRLFGVFNLRVNELAVTALDAHTVAFGNIERVRDAIDARANPAARASGELIGLATRTPSALLGFSANISPSLARGIDLGSAELDANVSSIRQAFGALTTTPAGFQMAAVARTERPQQAEGLRSFLDSLRSLGGMMVGQLPAARGGKLAQSTLDSLAIAARGNEVEIKFSVANADLTPLVSGLRP